MAESTLGLIETYGFVGAVEALDTAAKVSDVRLLSCEFVRGGIVTIIITGDVASVKSAVEASSIAVEKLGVLRHTHVIARAYDDVWHMLQKKLTNKHSKEKEEIKEITQEIKTEAIKESEKSKEKEEILVYKPYKREELENLKVTELRTIARGIKKISLTKKQIKFSKKEELIDAILFNSKRRYDK